MLQFYQLDADLMLMGSLFVPAMSGIVDDSISPKFQLFSAERSILPLITGVMLLSISLILNACNWSFFTICFICPSGLILLRMWTVEQV